MANRRQRLTAKRAVLPIAWLVGVVAATLAGFNPDPYLEYVRHIPPPHPYPIKIALFIAVSMAVQIGLLHAILRPASYQRSWARALIGFVISLAFLALGVTGAMHAPPPWAVYVFWLLAIVMAMLGLTLRSSINAITARP